jgi:serine/threonine-protein kinase HipA
VVDRDGALYIAKFPSRDDEWDVGLWESITWVLAGRCGLSIPQAKCEKFSARQLSEQTKAAAGADMAAVLESQHRLP